MLLSMSPIGVIQKAQFTCKTGIGATDSPTAPTDEIIGGAPAANVNIHVHIPHLVEYIVISQTALTCADAFVGEIRHIIG